MLSWIHNGDSVQNNHECRFQWEQTADSGINEQTEERWSARHDLLRRKRGHTQGASLPVGTEIQYLNSPQLRGCVRRFIVGVARSPAPPPPPPAPNTCIHIYICGVALGCAVAGRTRAALGYSCIVRNKNEIRTNNNSPREKMFQKLSSGYYRLNAEHTRCKVFFAPPLFSMRPHSSFAARHCSRRQSGGVEARVVPGPWFWTCRQGLVRWHS
jgi:hypothetical protein